MKPRAIVSEMDSYVPGKSQDEIASEFNLNKDDIIKLGSNENPLKLLKLSEKNVKT